MTPHTRPMTRQTPQHTFDRDSWIKTYGRTGHPSVSIEISRLLSHSSRNHLRHTCQKLRYRPCNMSRSTVHLRSKWMHWHLLYQRITPGFIALTYSLLSPLSSKSCTTACGIFDRDDVEALTLATMVNRHCIKARPVCPPSADLL